MTAVDEASAFLGDAARWLEDNVPERWRKERNALAEEEKVSIRREWDRALHRGGFSGLSLPVAIGGGGRSLRDDVLFHELAARAHAPESLGRIGRILTIPTLLTHGTQDQRERFIPPILTGDQVWCQGFSEPAAGSDLASLMTLATRVDGGWEITGQKIWVTLGQYADRCLLLARTSTDAARYRNLGLFMLDMRQQGVTCRPIKQLSGDSHFAELFLDRAFVDDADLIGEPGDGWRIAMTTLTAERGGIEAITRYVDMRSDTDLLLSCCGAGSTRGETIEELDTRVEVLRLQVLKALDGDDDAEQFRRSCMLKVMWSELWQEITEFAVGLGCLEHRAHWRHQYLEVRATSIYSGTNEIQRNIISERVLGLPR